MYFRKLTGEQCYLSPIDIDDAPKYTAWLNDLEVSRYLMLYDQAINEFSERQLLEKVSREHAYAIVDLATDSLIGNVGLHKISQTHRRAEFGIFIGNKDYWGKGYGTEAARLILGYGFDYLNLHSVMLCAYGFNERALACYKKVGFREIGRRREALEMEGALHDMIYMDILAGEFRASRNVRG